MKYYSSSQQTFTNSLSYDYALVQLRLSNSSTGEVVNIIIFNVTEFSFSQQYLTCQEAIQVVSTTQDNETELETMCGDALENLLLRTSEVYAQLIFTFQGSTTTYASQSIGSIRTGCWDSISYEFDGTQVCLDMSIKNTTCSFSSEYRARGALTVTATNEEVLSGIFYYSTQQTQICFSGCGASCKRDLTYNDVLFTLQGTKETSVYGEVRIAGQQTGVQGDKRGEVIVGGSVALAELVTMVVYYALVHLHQSGKLRTVKKRAKKEDVFDL